MKMMKDCLPEVTFYNWKKYIAIDCDLPIFMNIILTFQISFVKTYVFYNNLLEWQLGD